MSPLLSLICVATLGFEGDLIPGGEFTQSVSLAEIGNSSTISIPEEDPQLRLSVEYVAEDQVKIKVIDLLSDPANPNEVDSLQFTVKPILYITSLKGPFTFGTEENKRPINQLSIECNP